MILQTSGTKLSEPTEQTSPANMQFSSSAVWFWMLITSSLLSSQNLDKKHASFQYAFSYKLERFLSIVVI